jgi:hypothetical protein
MAWSVPHAKPNTDKEYIQNAAEAALELWTSYVRIPETPQPTDLLSNYQSVYFYLQEFLRYCVGRVFNITDEELKTIRIEPHSLPKDPLKMHGGTPASWLYHRRDGCPRIFLDYTVLETQIGKSERELLESMRAAIQPDDESWDRYLRARMTPLIAKLILHEIGHVVLHWDRDNPGPPENLVPDMPVRYEYHAWVFAGLVLGLAIGHIATTSRIDKGADTAWRHLLEECHQFSITN